MAQTAFFKAILKASALAHDLLDEKNVTNVNRKYATRSVITL